MPTMPFVLPSARVAHGDELVWLDQVDSTMEEARRRFTPGLAQPLWIVAGEQIAGRGRQGRTWISPPGNLHMTLLLPTRTPLRDQPKLGFAAGVALARAAKGLLPSHVPVALKWPNDLLVAGAKASGLLLEGMGGGAAVSIGIGINITGHPPDLPYAATHLANHLPGVSRERVFQALVGMLSEEIGLFAEGKGFALTRARWLAHAAHIGQRISIRQEDGRRDGIFEGIDEDGQLRLATPHGLRRIAAGDVFPLDK
jgi:BirA family transcriptional regulator, biotin operon repressor / biotin---[acetyl-CoA-carboxylase] ligase